MVIVYDLWCLLLEKIGNFLHRYLCYEHTFTSTLLKLSLFLRYCIKHDFSNFLHMS